MYFINNESEEKRERKKNVTEVLNCSLFSDSIIL